MSDTITVPRALLEQALDALENSSPDKYPEGAGVFYAAMDALYAAPEQPEPSNQCGETCERAKLCAACARALEQPEPKPVAWVKIQQGEITHSEMSDGSGCDFDLVGAGFVPLYTHLLRRDWRGLTPDETMHLMTKTAGQHWADEAHIQRFRGALEGKLRERNT